MANKSGIHINPKNKGKFTKKANAAGESVQAFAKKVSSNPSKYSAKTRKQAGFAKASRKFKHQAGGTPGLAQTTPGASSIADQYDQIGSGFDISAGFDSIDPNAASGVQANGQQDQASNPGSFSASPTGKKIMDRHTQNSAYVKDANLGMTAVTDIANGIQGQKQKREEYLQLLRGQTPKFMTNTNANGLNNTPAYTMFGGTDIPDTDYSGPTNEQYGHMGIGRNKTFWGTSGSIYKNGGQVSSDKAKEILKDGTANGKPLTDKQKRYFGWLAGGAKAQTGGPVAVTGPVQQSMAPDPTSGPTASTQSDPSKYNQDNSFDKYYGANATLSYYKNKLNDKLKAKNPQGFTDYFKGLQGARGSGKPEDAQKYVQDTQYNDYLSPDEVKQTLGDKDYQTYINSLKQVNQYNVSQGQQPLYGTKEGENDPSQLNYGRRFASLQVTPRYAGSDTTTGKSYARQYTYNPQSGQVELSETGDTTLRPQNVLPQQHQAGGTAVTVGGTLGNPQTMNIPSLGVLPKGMKYSPRFARLRPGANAADSGAYQHGFDMATGDRNFNYANMMPGMRDNNDPMEQDAYQGMMEGLQPHGLTAQLYLPKDTPGKRQTGGYAEGDEVDLTPAQIKQLKKQGYKIKHL
jgi:hypothetical protein